MPNKSDKLLGSTSIESNITNSITNEALGIDGIAIDKQVEVMRTINNESNPSVTPLKCAKNTEAIDMNMAVPFVFK